MSKAKQTLIAAFIVLFSTVLSACTPQLTATEAEKTPDTEQEASQSGQPSISTVETDGSLDAVVANGKIRVGVFSDKAPFGYMDENGDLQGYDVYFAKRLAQELFGEESAIEWVLLEPANRVEYLESDRVDIVLANFTQTEERAKAVDFALPYMKVSLGVVSPESASITDVSQLEGEKLLIIKGTTAETYFEEHYPEIELVKYDQISEAFQALTDGRGSALSQDNTLLLAWAQENDGFTVGIPSLGEPGVIAPAVKKGNTQLLNWVNETIVQLAEEQFFHADYDATLKPVYGESVDAAEIVVEGGDLS